MSTIDERYDPLLDPDASGCPHGCGRLTDDPYGGPCSRCWAALEDYESGAGWERVAAAMEAEAAAQRGTAVDLDEERPTFADIAAEKRRADV